MDFKKRYDNLNIAQKQAVDTIDGPVMVIAGPGTGKTELLGVRVANILQKTDTLPENILCLTFTDSGASAMRERLADIIGKDAYKVAIHTFHSFGSEIINQNAEFFYKGANFKAADELSSHEIIRSIFEKLKHNNPLAGLVNDEYTYLSDSLTLISEIKKSGLNGPELISILGQNDIVIEKVEGMLAPLFGNRISNKVVPLLSGQIENIRNINQDIVIPSVTPLSRIIADTLETAVSEAIESNSTKSVTAWKNAWFIKNDKGEFILKSRERQIKLRALCDIYEKYLADMHSAKLYDFDDMILEVVHKMEEHDDLRFNLQEKYQYILVDEFQDTNMAQMRILHNLTNNEVHEGMPNILVVGDDDQAIYSFQGADVSNIIDFRSNFPRAQVITLTNNYRSTKNILDHSRDIILQGHNRLENIFSDVNKQLISQNENQNNGAQLFEAETVADERQFIADDILRAIKSGEKPNSIAVLTRRHAEISMLLPYLYKSGISVNYERHDNILEQPIIILIEQISRVLINLATGRLSEVNAGLPRMLAHSAWGIKPYDIWKLSLNSHSRHTSWIENMANDSEFTHIHKWLIETSARVFSTPLEQMLDIIVGKNINDEETTDFVSPIYDYYFSAENLKNNPDEYLTYLDSLRTLRSKLKEYHTDEIPTLESFIDFITKNRAIGSTINSSRQSAKLDDAVNVMTAHKSKGLEFDRVYIINAVDNTWGEKARNKNRLINYPENLPLAPAGETNDERLRLFYVAATRAKKHLSISYSSSNDFGKPTLRAAFLMGDKWQADKIFSSTDIDKLTEISELAWYQPLVTPITHNMHDLLMPMLENYKLSVTHLHNFLDVTRGGPQNFLMQNLLQFPSAKSATAAFGTAIHNTMQQTHSHFIASGEKLAIDKIIEIFTVELKNQYLPAPDFEKYLQKGTDALTTYFEQNYKIFNSSQKTELNFASQNSIVDEAHLAGKLDLVDIDNASKTMSVTDYKTGKPITSWHGKTDYEKIKLHKYKQQLMFYKLLVENSRDYHNYCVSSGILQFIEPTKANDIVSLESSFDSSELNEFKILLNAVWNKIINLDLPDISAYETSLKGILEFEKDLVNADV